MKQYDCLFCAETFEAHILRSQHVKESHLRHIKQVNNLSREASQSLAHKIAPSRLISQSELVNLQLAQESEAALSTELSAYVQDVSLPASQQERWNELVRQVNDVISSEKVTGELISFGSGQNGFATKNSDLDLTFSQSAPKALNIPIQKLEKTRKSKRDYDEDCAEALFDVIVRGLLSAGFEYSDITSKFGARTPIICVKTADVEMDIGLANLIGVKNTQLLSAYSAFDPRGKQLGVAVKLWAKKRGLSYAVSRTLCSYAFILMVIRFLQVVFVVPNLQMDYPDWKQREMCENYDCSFETDLALYSELKGQNSSSIGTLFFQFFQYYANFDWQNECVSIRRPHLLKSEKKWRDEIAIEDPFELRRNLGDTCSDDTPKLILNEIKRAYLLLSRGESFQSILEDKDF